MAMKKPVVKKPTAASVEKFARGRSGRVPEGKVRFSMNMKIEIHDKLRRAAGRRTAETGKAVTMGELVADLIKSNL